MASNPNVNKVVYGNDTLIDLTADTVKANNLLEGYTAHSKSGAVITGSVPNYYKYNASKRLRYSDINPSVATSCFLRTENSVSILLGLGAFRYGIKITVSGTNIILSSYETIEDISTITLATVGANYTDQFYVKEVIVLNPYSFLITYYSANGADTYTAQSLRMIRVKEDGTLSQSSAITIANATTASLKCWAKVIPMFEGGNQSWMAVQVRETISSGAKLIYATRIYANFTTGALTIPSSSAWVTVASSNVNVTINSLNLNLDRGGFMYSNSSSETAFFIWHGYNNGYVNKTKSDFGFNEDSTSMSRIILGKLVSGAVVFCDQVNNISRSYVDVIIFMYDYASQKFVSRKTVRITKSSNSIKVVGMYGDVVIFSDGNRYQLVFDSATNGYLAKQLPKMNDVGTSAPQRSGNYKTIGSESNRLMNLYIDDAE